MGATIYNNNAAANQTIGTGESKFFDKELPQTDEFYRDPRFD